MQATDFSQRWVNLASEKLGGEAVACSDDFFAPMQRMLNDEPPLFIDGKYDDHGKWMDGWESRRRRGGGHDWCVVKLARAGIIHGVEIDTTHFTGNYPPAASVEACFFDRDDAPDASADWHSLVAETKLKGDREHQFKITAEQAYTHIRLNLFPDGGVARLRVYGEPKINWQNAGETDLAAALNGGVALCCNDEHYGAIRNLLLPGRGVNMGDGWETRRRREPGYDWVVIALAHPGVIQRVEVDTAHFKGNYPDRCSVQGARLKNSSLAELPQQSENWSVLLPESKLRDDWVHNFRNQVTDIGAVSHIRLNIFPDGGISRLRLFGMPELIERHD